MKTIIKSLIMISWVAISAIPFVCGFIIGALSGPFHGGMELAEDLVGNVWEYVSGKEW